LLESIVNFISAPIQPLKLCGISHCMLFWSL